MRHGSFQGRRNNNNSNNRHRSGGQGGGHQPRSSGSQGGNQRPHRNQLFDSNGPDVRVRGTAFQINEKYLTLAKDAASSGDLILAENYLQHAEHYQRIINEFEPANTTQPRQDRQDGQSDDNGGNQQDDGQELSSHQGHQPQPRQQLQSQSDNAEAQPSATGEAGGEDKSAVRVMRRERAPRKTIVKEGGNESGSEDLGLPSSLFSAPKDDDGRETA